MGITQIEQDYVFMCSTGSAYRLSNVDEHILADITSFGCETSVDLSKTILSGVDLEKIHDGGGDAQIESFCVLPSQHGDLIVSTSKKYLFVQTMDAKWKIEIPKEVGSFKAIYNLNHCL